jgi:hypothetical protein
VLAAVERVSVEVPLLFAGGVTEAGEKEAEAPEGRPEALRETAELKPFTLETVTVEVPLEPWTTETEVGDAATEKSGVAVVEQLENL